MSKSLSHFNEVPDSFESFPLPQLAASSRIRSLYHWIQRTSVRQQSGTGKKKRNAKMLCFASTTNAFIFCPETCIVWFVLFILPIADYSCSILSKLQMEECNCIYIDIYIVTIVRRYNTTKYMFDESSSILALIQNDKFVVATTTKRLCRIRRNVAADMAGFTDLLSN